MRGRLAWLASIGAFLALAVGGVAVEASLVPATSGRVAATTSTSTSTTSTSGSSSSSASSSASSSSGGGCATASASASAGTGSAASSSSSSSSSATCTTTTTTTTTTTSSATLTVSKTGASAALGTVTSNPAGIACGATCSASFTAGQTVTLTASNLAGARFHGWGGSCSSFGNSTTCVLTLAAGATTVTADFELVSPAFRPPTTFVASRIGTASVVRSSGGWIVRLRFRMTAPATASPCEVAGGSCVRSFPSALLTDRSVRLGFFEPRSTGAGTHVYALALTHGPATVRLVWPALTLG